MASNFSFIFCIHLFFILCSGMISGFDLRHKFTHQFIFKVFNSNDQKFLIPVYLIIFFWIEATPVCFPWIYIHSYFSAEVFYLFCYFCCFMYWLTRVWWLSFIWFIFLKNILGCQLIPFWFPHLLTCSGTQLSPPIIWRDRTISWKQGANNSPVLWYHQYAPESAVCSLYSCLGTHIWPPLAGITGHQKRPMTLLFWAPLCPLHPLSLCMQQLLWHSSHHSQMFSNVHICFPLIQSKLFAVFQEIFKMSDALMAFFHNTALDLFRIHFLSFLRFGSNGEGRCARWVCVTFSTWMLTRLLPQLFSLCSTFPPAPALTLSPPAFVLVLGKVPCPKWVPLNI